jgi:hypothetical protein
MKNLDRVSAEVRAHADHLARFCKEHNVGFVVAIFDGEHVLRASNAEGKSLRAVLEAFDNDPVASEQVRPGVPS